MISRSQMKRQLYQIGGLSSLYNIGSEGQKPIYPRISDIESSLSNAEQKIGDPSLGSFGGTSDGEFSSPMGGVYNQSTGGELSPRPGSYIDFGQLSSLFAGVGDPRTGAPVIPGNQLQMIMRGAASMPGYAGGGIVSLKKARDILEAEAPPGESLAYINPEEAMMLKYMGGAGIPINSSGIPSYFVKGLVKGVKSAVKGAVGAVKDIVSSDIGKLALIAAATYGLGGGFGAGGFKFGNLPGAGFLQGAKTGIGNLLLGTPGDMGGRVAGTSLFSKIGGAAKAIGGSNLLSAGLGFLGGAAGSMLSPEQIQEGMQRNPAAVREYLAQYYKNVNPEATESEAEQFALAQTREYAAEGGIIGRQNYGIGGMITKLIENNPNIFKQLQMASPVRKYQAQYMQNLNPEMDEEDVIEYIRKNAAYGGPMGEPRQNPQGVMELDYRQEGGFVPVGIKEKADDVPAMLSKNEFVFTADAVRNAGDGDVEKGAQRLYNTMKTLENGGIV